MDKDKLFDEHIHMIPRDSTEHIEKESCWCRPEWDPKNKMEYQSGLAEKKLFVHKSLEEIQQ